MHRVFNSKWFKIVISVIAVLLIFVIIAAAAASRVSPLSGAAGAAASPFEKAASSLGSGFKSIGTYFRTKKSYQAEIKQLKSQVASYQNQLVDYEQIKQKNKLYEDFLSIKDEHSDYNVVAADLIGRDSSNQYYSFVFNKGTSSGIKVNDPVIYGKGYLVGVVTKAAPTYCVVSSILDPSVKVSSYEVRTRETGFTSTTSSLSKKGCCRLSGLDRDTAIAKGGIICTAGDGGIYPRDLIIGTVKEIKNETHDISAYAVIEPGVDFSQLEDALIITSFNGQGDETS